jgi:hypothetical protein
MVKREHNLCHGAPPRIAGCASLVALPTFPVVSRALRI